MSISVTMVRLYFSESDGLLQSVIAKLHDDEKVMGVTVFRGISGFGRSGRVHSASLLDLTAHLPIVVEFFDEPAKVEGIIDHLKQEIDSGRIISWPAEVAV